MQWSKNNIEKAIEEFINEENSTREPDFIDDYYKNFVELNSNGVCTFLMSCSWNSKYNVGYKRIKNFQDFKERFL